MLKLSKLEVPPPYNFLMTRGGGGEVKNPAGGARGVGGVRGVEICSSKKPGGIDDIQLLQTAFNLAATLICSVKQTLAADSL